MRLFVNIILYCFFKGRSEQVARGFDSLPAVNFAALHNSHRISQCVVSRRNGIFGKERKKKK